MNSSLINMALGERKLINFVRVVNGSLWYDLYIA